MAETIQPKHNAPDSQEIQNFRQRVNTEMSSRDAEITPEAKEKAIKLMKHWIARHEGERVNLKEKSFSLFDENQHPEETHSRYIAHLILELKGMTGKSKPSTSLKGRVTNPEEIHEE